MRLPVDDGAVRRPPVPVAGLVDAPLGALGEGPPAPSGGRRRCCGTFERGLPGTLLAPPDIGSDSLGTGTCLNMTPRALCAHGPCCCDSACCWRFPTKIRLLSSSWLGSAGVRWPSSLPDVHPMLAGRLYTSESCGQKVCVAVKQELTHPTHDIHKLQVVAHLLCLRLVRLSQERACAGRHHAAWAQVVEVPVAQVEAQRYVQRCQL
jgi:hypothetical protein